MKKTVLSLLLFLAAVLPAMADNVTPSAAKEAAEGFLKIRGNMAGIRQVDQPGTRAGEENDFYVFNLSGSRGFVIISGDDAVEPVLAYSDKGEFIFDGMPANMASWMEEMHSSFRHVREYGIEADEKIKEQWMKVRSGVRTRADEGDEKVLKTALWNQTAPYNRLTPVVEGVKTPTGCVATATSIIMRYHKWPESGTGTLPSYTYVTDGSKTRISQDGHRLGHTYEWDLMPEENITEANTDEEIDAISQLMYDVGIMVQMSYEGSGSGAFTTDAALGLVEHMGYDASCRNYKKEFYTTEEWIGMIKSQIDQNLPILYSSYSNSGGHAYVVDGYDKDGMMHINWGWGGSNNGFFTFPSFSDYRDGHHMVLDIKKDEGGKPIRNMLSFSSIDLTNGNLEQGGSFIVKISDIMEVDAMLGYEGELTIARTSQDGSVKEILSDIEELFIEAKYYRPSIIFECTMTEAAELGDIIIPVHRPAGSDTWQKLRFNEEGNGVSMIPLFSKEEFIDSTHLTYDKESQTLIVTSMPGVRYTVLDAKNEADRTVSVRTEGELTRISLAGLASGTYSLSILAGNMELKVRFTK